LAALLVALTVAWMEFAKAASKADLMAFRWVVNSDVELAALMVALKV